MEFYKCQYFAIQELVDKKTFETWGEKSWMFFNPHALMALDSIRMFYNVPVIANTWDVGGQSEWRGLRPPYCTVGQEHSQHRFGNAFDIDVTGISAEQVRQDIIRLKNSIFIFINCLETEINYVHFDCRNSPERIFLVPKPS